MGKLKNYWVRFWRIKNIEYYFLVLILLLGFVVRLYRIDNPVADWHSWRQADTASVTRIYVDEGINPLYPKYYDISTAQSGIFNPEGYRFVEFPIYNVIHAGLFILFPMFNLEVWGRLLSIIFATLSTYLIFLLGRKYIGIEGGVLAAFFYAFLPFNIYFTRVILPEPAALFFALFSVWLFINYLDKSGNLWLLGSALTFAVALLIKPYVAFYGLPILMLAVGKFGWKGLFKANLIIAALIVTLPFFAWRIWEAQFPEGIPFWEWAFNGDGIRFKPSYWRWIFGERLGNMLLGGWGLIPFTFGVLAIKKWKDFTALMLFSALLYVVVVATANVKHDYYQTLIVPAVALTLAKGSVFLWSSKHFNRKILRTLLLFSLFLMFLIGVERHKFLFNVNHWEIVKAGQAVDRAVEKDALVIAPYNGDTAFLYQTKRRGWPVMDRSLDQLMEKGANYYVSVNFDDVTNKVMQEYEVVEKTDEYVIIKLQ